ncbi:MAG: insulinase family protein [Planctomycetes bacterium]|nr:insulinase family protein [Planctomycetota bacterium]MCC7172432.1 insulinase family protein [Planctomycetota bacterium]
MHRAKVHTALALATSLLWCSASFSQELTYEKYKLDNGLTVILHVDRTLPSVAINTWFYVGSKDEAVGRSGFAHLFEHLMFMGTERVPTGQFDFLMEVGGGHNNASTDYDRTNYYSSGPSSILPTLLWLDADRLEDLGRMMTIEKLDLQRDVVRNERRQTTENVPYGKSEEMIGSLLFPTDHPYHHSVIGSHEDLEAGTLQDVKDFFAQYYVPNNASLVVAGDFDPAVVKPLIAQLFGTLPRGADPVHATKPAARTSGVRRVTVTDAVQLAALRMTWASPAAYQPGDAEMQIAASVLGDGRSSRLYQRLVVEDALAVDVSVQQISLLLDSMFQIDVYAKPGSDLGVIERIVDEEIARLAKDGPAADELQSAAAQEERSRSERIQNLVARADLMNEYQFYWGEPDSLRADLDRFRKATAEGVRDAVGRTLTPEDRLIVRVVPDQPERAASPRDTRPTDFEPTAFVPQEPTRIALANGIELEAWERTSVPQVHLLLQFSCDGALDPAGKAGRTALLAAMLEEGAGSRDADELARAFDVLGSELDIDADHETLTIGLTALRRNLEPSLALLQDVLTKPRFDAADFERAKSLHLEGLKQALDRPEVAAQIVGARMYWGVGHPFATPADGTLDSIASLTLDDVRAAFAGIVRPDACRAFLVGALPATEAKTLLDAELARFVAPATPKLTGLPIADVPQGDALRVVLVDRPGAVQTIVGYTWPGVTAADPRRPGYELLGTILGGSFTSRLMQNLRESKGYTYGARSRPRFERTTGTVSAGAAVRADVTGASLKEFVLEFDRMRNGDVSTDEAAKAAATVRNGLVEDFQEIAGVAASAAELALHRRPFAALAQDLAALSRFDAPTLNALAKEFVVPERGVLVLVGDAASIRGQLAGLGLPEPVDAKE